MVRIPDTVLALSNANADPRVLRRILIATVMRYQGILGDEEPFILTADDLSAASAYKLVMTDMIEEDAVLLSVRKR